MPFIYIYIYIYSYILTLIGASLISFSSLFKLQQPTPTLPHSSLLPNRQSLISPQSGSPSPLAHAISQSRLLQSCLLTQSPSLPQSRLPQSRLLTLTLDRERDTLIPLLTPHSAASVATPPISFTSSFYFCLFLNFGFDWLEKCNEKRKWILKRKMKNITKWKRKRKRKWIWFTRICFCFYLLDLIAEFLWVIFLYYCLNLNHALGWFLF